MRDLRKALLERLDAYPLKDPRLRRLTLSEIAGIVDQVEEVLAEKIRGHAEDEDVPWWCRRCRAENSFPHSWCATIGCDCDECQRPQLPRLRIEMERRWPDL
jgi:hypothetical protein